MQRSVYATSHPKSSSDTTSPKWKRGENTATHTHTSTVVAGQSLTPSSPLVSVVSLSACHL